MTLPQAGVDNLQKSLSVSVTLILQATLKQCALDERKKQKTEEAGTIPTYPPLTECQGERSCLLKQGFNEDQIVLAPFLQ